MTQLLTYFPPLSITGGVITDEAFFGIPDGSDGWLTPPLLQYNTFEGLSQVRMAAQNNDYAVAKEKLLEYYRAKRVQGMLEYPITSKGSEEGVSIGVQMTIDKILTSTDALAKFEIPVEPAYISIPISNSTRMDTFFIMDADMDGTRAEMHSMENANMPYIEVVADGITINIPAIADTFLSSGANKDTIHSSEDILYIQEQAGVGPTVPVIPHSINTAQPYIKFDWSLLDDDANVTSITLNIYAKSGSNHVKNAYLFKARNFESVDLNTVTWSQHRPPALNFKETGFIWLSNNQYPDAYDNNPPEIGGMKAEFGVEYEWGNARSRLGQIPSVLEYYKGTQDEKYAYAALDLLMSQYNQRANGEYPRNLETGWRSQNVLAAIFGTLDSELMTAEVLTAMLKFAYSHASYLQTFYGDGRFPSNWQSAFASGFFAINGYLPELSQTGWWTTAKSWILSLYNSGALLNSDGSYPESTTNYIAGVLNELRGVMEVIRAIEGDSSTEFATMEAMYTKLATYYVDLGMNYGFTPNWGDGSRHNIRKWAKSSNEFIANPYFEFIGSNGASGAPPNYTSKLYPTKALTIMRQNWDYTGLSGFINVAGGGTHGHADDLSLDLYAYGYPLLVDAGTRSYDVTAPDANTRKKTISHNTIEIDGMDQRLDNVKQNPGTMMLKSNPKFDLLNAKTSWAYDGFTMNRKVFFLKDTGWIVSDIVVPSDMDPHTYKQAWHPDEGNSIEIDEETKAARATFIDRPSINIVPADPEQIVLIEDQTYMAGVDSTSLQNYVRYEKTNVSGPQTFDTLLIPDEVGLKTDVIVERIALGDTEVQTATALALNFGPDRVATYYTSNEPTPVARTFGGYEYDGEMAYIEEDGEGEITQVALTRGKALISEGKTLVQSRTTITDLTIEWEGDNLALSSSDNLPILGIDIYSFSEPNVVTFNGELVPFEYEDRVVSIEGSNEFMIEPIDDKVIDVDEELSFTVNALNTQEMTTYSLASVTDKNGAVVDTTEAGISFNIETGVFSWTPSVAGSYEIVFSATSSGRTVTETVIITVLSTTLSIVLDKPIADSYISNRTDYNDYIHGTLGSVSVRNHSTNGYIGYFKFDLSSLLENTVTGAKLRLFVSGKSTTGEVRHRLFGLSDNTWDEATMTWNTGSPNHASTGYTITEVGTTATILDEQSITTARQYVEFDISDENFLSFINSQKNNALPYVSFLVAGVAHTGENVNYSSKENAKAEWPQLVLDVKKDAKSTATVSYSTTDPTNGDVIATITPSEPVTITNNGGSSSYTFSENGSFTFEFADAAGNEGTATATVTNIVEEAATNVLDKPIADSYNNRLHSEACFVPAHGESVLSTQVPSGYGADQQYELGTKFKTTVNGHISRVRLYTHEYEGGNHTVRIWKASDGTLLAGPFSWNVTAGVRGLERVYFADCFKRSG